MALPNGEQLRALELESRKKGSKLQMVDLVGSWKLKTIWGKTNQEASSLSGSLLRAAQARLAIKIVDTDELELHNSIGLLGITLSFKGPGVLVQKRPLLQFYFQKLQIGIAQIHLISFSLPAPTQGAEPFFALIARGETETGDVWLAARGRGGGLALWMREDERSA